MFFLFQRAYLRHGHIGHGKCLPNGGDRSGEFINALIDNRQVTDDSIKIDNKFFERVE
jgi:hypothetical protein